MSKPLDHIKVIDLTRLIPGPFCTSILSDLGADVVKIEDMHKGDYLKDIKPLTDNGRSVAYDIFNRGKKRVYLDFKNEEGRSLLLQAIRSADVVVESYRSGVMDALDLGYTALQQENPRVILASITGYGQQSSMKDKAGHDINYMAQAGFIQDDKLSTFQWSDYVGGGLYGVIAIMAALIKRDKTHRGEHLDVSITSSMMHLGGLNNVLTAMGVSMDVLNGQIARYRLYRAKDNCVIALGALEGKFWKRFLQFVGRDDLSHSDQPYPDFNPNYHKTLSEIFAQRSGEYWKTVSQENDFCLTVVAQPDKIDDKLSAMGEGFWELNVQNQKHLVPVFPVMNKKNEKTGSGIKDYSRSFLKDLGLNKQQIESLIQKGIVK